MSPFTMFVMSAPLPSAAPAADAVYAGSRNLAEQTVEASGMTGRALAHLTPMYPPMMPPMMPPTMPPTMPPMYPPTMPPTMPPVMPPLGPPAAP
jgi:hypothetical protein